MKNVVYFVIIIICFHGCINDEAKNATQLEQKVYQDIFPGLIEQTFRDFRKMYTPPPPPYSPDAINNEHSRKYKDKEEMDEAFRKAMENYKIYIDTTDFAPLNIIVNDSVLKYPKEMLKDISSDNRIKEIDTSKYKNSYKIDLSKIKVGKDYILKYKSEFSKSIDELINSERLKYPIEKKHLRQFSGMLYLYRIYFSNNKNNGVFEVGFNCGKLCGCGYRVFIKKENDTWQIVDIDNLGCA